MGFTGSVVTFSIVALVIGTQGIYDEYQAMLMIFSQVLHNIHLLWILSLLHFLPSLFTCYMQSRVHIDGLEQERCNSSALAISQLTLPKLRLEYCREFNINYMSNKAPEHQQPCLSLCKINHSLSPMRQYFKHSCYLSVTTWQKMQNLFLRFLKAILSRRWSKYKVNFLSITQHHALKSASCLTILLASLSLSPNYTCSCCWK